MNCLVALQIKQPLIFTCYILKWMIFEPEILLLKVSQNPIVEEKDHYLACQVCGKKQVQVNPEILLHTLGYDNHFEGPLQPHNWTV